MKNPKATIRCKYNNKITKLDGFTFASMKEAKRYQILKALEKAGAIHSLVVHPSFTLIDGFTRYDLDAKKFVKERPITYVADFKYIVKDGELEDTIIVEDVKASPKCLTDVYRLKRKLLLRIYSNMTDTPYVSTTVILREVYK